MHSASRAAYALLALALLQLDCGDSRTTASADPGAGDGGVGDGATTDVEVPVGCDPKKDPKDAPACVVDGFGLFVDGAAGADTSQGTGALGVNHGPDGIKADTFEAN